MGSSYRANNQGFFFKPPSALSGPSDPIILPVNAARRIDHECELAIVISKQGRDIAREDYRDYIFGFSCLIDAVIRGKEERVTRKGFDTFCPIGPWIVTADEVGDAASHLQGRLWVNGELKQAAGTPAGVGPIRHGDKVKIEFERVGSMTLDVIQGESGKYSIFALPLPAESKP